MMVAEPQAKPIGIMVNETAPSEWTPGWPQTPAEFGVLITRVQDRLVRYAFCKLKDVCDAEDVVQEVFVKAFANRHALRHVRSVEPYLYRMVSNLCVDRMRRPRPVVVPIEETNAAEIADERPLASERLIAAEQLKRAEELLARLPDDQAEVLRLRVLNDQSFAEIAEAQGCSLATVKSRLRYGIARLRRLLSRGKERSR